MAAPDTSSRLGIVGLGTMGANLALNLADHDIAIVGFDRDPQRAASLPSRSRTSAQPIEDVTSAP